MRNYLKKNIILIVGGYSSGKYLAPLFSGIGYDCIHITTSSEMNNPALKHFDKSHYIDNIIIDSENDYNILIHKLDKYKVRLVIAGSETGVKLADSLSKYFKTPRNTYSLSNARRNKYLMHEILRKNSLNSAKQFITNDIKQALIFYREMGVERIVVKPPSSSSSDHVFYCNSEIELADAFFSILNKKNILNELNNEVLIQEYLSGCQYIVNSISSDGYHHVVDVWREVNENDDSPSNHIYSELLSKNDDLCRILNEYAVRVLDSLGIKYGASHAEIRLTETGPCLIELSSRLPGNVDFLVTENIYGISQVSLMPYAMFNTDLFKTIIKHNHIDNNIHARLVYLHSNIEGHVLREPDISYFMSLESVESVGLQIKKGDYLHKTNRALRKNRPGFIYLINKNYENLKNDYLLIKQFENKFYNSFLN
jgi:biotin carboxylase